METLLQIRIPSLRYSIFFVNIGSKILRLKYRKEKRPFKTYLRKSVVNSFFINPVQESEIEKSINNPNQNKSLGPRSIPLKILQSHVDVLKQPLAYLVNLSFQQVYFQRHLKPKYLLLSLKKKILNILLIITPSLFCQFLTNCMKNVCILAFTRF